MKNFSGRPVRSKLLNSVILSPSFGRRTSRDASDFIGPSRLFAKGPQPKSLDAATTSDIFRQVLRPKEGLRMTEFRRLTRQGVFRSRSFAGIVATLLLCVSAFSQQDKFQGVVTQGVERVRIAVADFKPANADPNTGPLLTTFNSVLFSDLQNAGIFDVVSKSFNPLQVPGTPQEVTLDAWANPPTNAAMLAFGNLGVSGGQVSVFGWLYDVKNTVSPQVLGKQYREDATQDNARLIAHRFADEIIFRLGGGIPGIAESKTVFVSNRTGTKEIWMMDYDGNGEHAVTKLGSIALSPRISPDSSRIAFVELGKRSVNIRMFSLDLNRPVSFPAIGGTTISPAWSPDGLHLAFSSSRTGDPEIYVSNASGGELTRLTEAHGPDVSPVWNPKTGGQIAWISGRSGLPQLYIMASDGTNVQRMTDTGYAVSPSWSPNGQYLVFAWSRKYGPGVPGAQDIYIMDVASKTWAQLTHDAGSNDFPSWSPDGRHIAFQSNRSGTTQIWTMLADGTQQHQLTHTGQNTQPNWSWK
jgi:TolB protein